MSYRKTAARLNIHSSNVSRIKSKPTSQVLQRYRRNCRSREIWSTGLKSRLSIIKHSVCSGGNFSRFLNTALGNTISLSPLRRRIQSMNIVRSTLKKRLLIQKIGQKSGKLVENISGSDQSSLEKLLSHECQIVLYNDRKIRNWRNNTRKMVITSMILSMSRKLKKVVSHGLRCRNGFWT